MRRAAAALFCSILAAGCSDEKRTPTSNDSGVPADTGTPPDSGEAPDLGADLSDTGEPPDMGIADAGVEDVGTITGPTIVVFTASPQMVAAGQRTTLVYTVRDAVSVSIVAMPGDTLLDMSSMLSGSLMSLPLDTGTRFVLTAVDSMSRSAMQTTFVGVDPGTPVINSFIATPAAAPAGGSTTLSWDVSANTTRVRILQGTTMLYEAPAGMIQQGSFEVTNLVAGDNPFTLEAWNFAHQTTSLVVVAGT